MFSSLSLCANNNSVSIFSSGFSVSLVSNSCLVCPPKKEVFREHMVHPLPHSSHFLCGEITSISPHSPRMISLSTADAFLRLRICLDHLPAPPLHKTPVCNYSIPYWGSSMINLKLFGGWCENSYNPMYMVRSTNGWICYYQQMVAIHSTSADHTIEAVFSCTKAKPDRDSP